MAQHSVGPFYVDSITSDRRDYDCSSLIAECRQEERKLMTLLMKARKLPTKTTKCVWFDQAPQNNWTQINFVGGYNDSATSFVVDDASKFAQYDIFKLPRTGEVFRVSSSTIATNTIVVEPRPFAGSAAAILDKDWIVRMGNAMVENSTPPASKLSEPDEYYNKTQIFRTTFDASASNNAEATKTSPTERIRLRKLKMKEHKIDIESAFWWGERVDGTTTHIRASQGILSRLTTNTWNVNGVLTQKNLNSFLKDVFLYGSGSKVLVGSRIVTGAISELAMGKMVVSESAKQFGLNIMTYITPQGDELDIIPSDLFVNYYSGYGVILDMQDVFYRPLINNDENRDTKLRQNIQNPGVDGWQDEFLTECAFQLRNEPAHGYFYGCTG